MTRQSAPVLFFMTAIACAPEQTSKPVDVSDVDTNEADSSPSCEDIDVEMSYCDFVLDERAEGEPFRFTTSACWTVIIDRSTIMVTDSFGLNFVESWGDPHENLNSKHIKDWLGSRRTLLFPGRDGDVTLTMDAAEGAHGLITSSSLYDGHRHYAIDNETNTIVFSSEDAAVTSARELAEADGEASRITPMRCERVSWDYEYLQEEAEDGTPLDKEPIDVPLGTTGGTPNPTQVNDLYDDPRLNHT